MCVGRKVTPLFYAMQAYWSLCTYFSFNFMRYSLTALQVTLFESAGPHLRRESSFIPIDSCAGNKCNTVCVCQSSDLLSSAKSEKNAKKESRTRQIVSLALSLATTFRVLWNLLVLEWLTLRKFFSYCCDFHRADFCRCGRTFVCVDSIAEDLWNEFRQQRLHVRGPDSEVTVTLVFLATSRSRPTPES
jgi:hypothetical protein